MQCRTKVAQGRRERLLAMETRTERITIRIPSKLRKNLEALAEKDRRKLSEYLYLVLEDHVETLGKGLAKK